MVTITMMTLLFRISLIKLKNKLGKNENWPPGEIGEMIELENKENSETQKQEVRW